MGGGGGPACRPGETRCPAGCKNLGIDLDNCGRCGQPCQEGANATATCSGGTCGLRCSPGFADCDLNPLNGCETNFSSPSSCGACRNVCPSGPNAAATCALGVCGLSCAPGFGNCDFFSNNGCEADLNSPANCATCGNLCRIGPNQLATCFMGMCGSQCRPGFADCDLLPGNGCEANLQSPATCGSCTNMCGPGLLCGGGVCGTGCPAPAVGVLTLNTTVMGNLPAGLARFPLPTCSMESTQVEDFWTLTITTPSTVVLETGGTLDTVLVLRSSCTATTDLGCNDDTPGINLLSRVTAMLQPGVYTVLVKQWGPNTMGGPYSLSATIAGASNAVCSGATQLIGGVPLRNQFTVNGGAQSTACLPAAGGQLFYRVDVPPNQRATVTTTTTRPFDVAVRLLNSCGAPGCLSSSQGAAAQVLTFDNRTPGVQSIVVSVSAANSGSNGTFDIQADLGPIPSSNNITCSAATPLVVNGMPVTGEVIDTGGAPLASCLPGQAGRVRYYSVVVPGRGAVTVTAGPLNFDLGLRVFSSCAATACAEFGDATTGVAPESLRLTNSSFSPQTFIVVVSSLFIGTGGTFGIGAVTSTPSPANNAFCDTPTALPPGVAVAGELALTGGMPLTNLCLPTQSGYVRYYSVAVPPGNTLQAIVSPGALNGLDVGARVLTSCAAATCAASSDSPGLAPEVTVVNNTSAATQTFLIAAGSVNTNPTGANNFSVLANVAPSAPNATCPGATLMSVGQTLMGESLSGGGAPSTACLPAVTGLTRYYQVVAGPGERLAITVIPANFDASLRVFDSCAALTCAASADASPGVAPETVSLQNDTATAKVWFISVSAPATVSNGTYALRVVRTPYSLTAITASCSDLSMVPDILGVATSPMIADDASTQTLPLPAGFAFRFFNVGVTHYSACMNGFAQLFPSAAGTPDCTFTNTALPDAFPPNGFLAPLWDDLFPVPTGTTHIRSLSSGVAPNRIFTIEWFDAAFLTTGAGPERLRFQAKLTETSGVVEFHYCSLQLNGGSLALLTGGSATVGLEDASGAVAIQYEFNTPGTVSSGGGLRFIPQP